MYRTPSVDGPPERLPMNRSVTGRWKWRFGILAVLFMTASCALPEPPRPMQQGGLETPPAHLDVVEVGAASDQQGSPPPVTGSGRSIDMEKSDLPGDAMDDPAVGSLQEEKRFDRLALRFAAENGREWGLAAPREELTLHSIRTDEQGTTRVAIQQMYRHIPVWDRGVTIHFDSSGEIDRVRGRLIPTPEGLNTVPRIGPGEAMAAVGEMLASDAGCATCQAEGVILVSENGPRMAYHVTAVPARSQRRSYFVDAETGELLRASGGTAGGSDPAETSSEALSGDEPVQPDP